MLLANCHEIDLSKSPDTMRRTILYSIFTVMCLMAAQLFSLSQSRTYVDARVSEIRKAYQEAKENAAQRLEALREGDEYPLDRFILQRTLTYPSVGVIHGTTTMYTSRKEVEDKDGFIHEYYVPLLVENSFNVSETVFYEEYLYDYDSENLIFYYVKDSGADLRIYIDTREDTIVKVIPDNGTDEIDIFARDYDSIRKQAGVYRDLARYHQY